MTLSSLPPEILADLSEPVRAHIRYLEASIGDLIAKIAELEARLNQNSSNSSKPPSSDPPHGKPAPPKPPSGKRRGGQLGHPKAQRMLLPPDEIIPLKPAFCRGCSRALKGDDLQPFVHQVHEIPPIKPHVVEYRCHQLSCAHCGTATRAPLPIEATSGYGPRAQAIAALLTGSCRMGKRGTSQLMEDVFGLSMSPATVCKLQHRTAKALQPIAEEALVYTRSQPANVDETGWYENNKRAWLWVAVTPFVVAFLIRKLRDRKSFDDLRDNSPEISTTDRYSVYTHLPKKKRQVCWAHLRRDFQAMIDRQSAGSQIGEELLLHSDILFENWYRVRDGTLNRKHFRSQYVVWLRREVRELLERGAVCGCAKTAATCKEILSVEESLWTFARVAGIEPTNNAAEREVRHAVCWRKTSYGTASESGSRFVERILTVISSCRRQKRNVLQFLMEAVKAERTGGKPPTLLPVKVAAAA